MLLRTPLASLLLCQGHSVTPKSSYLASMHLIGMMNTLSQGSLLLFPILKHTTLSLGEISILCKTLIWTDLPIDCITSRSLLSY